MVKINRIHMNYENPLIGAEEMPQFGWEIESSKREVVQKSYQLQISENENLKNSYMTVELSGRKNLHTYGHRT